MKLSLFDGFPDPTGTKADAQVCAVAPALHSLVSRRVPVDEQGAVQGALSSLVSLANVFAPPISAWGFAACIGPDARIHLPGISFFGAALMLLAAFGLATRALREPR